MYPAARTRGRPVLLAHGACPGSSAGESLPCDPDLLSSCDFHEVNSASASGVYRRVYRRV